MKKKPGHYRNLLKEQMRRSIPTKNTNKVDLKRVPPGLPPLPPEVKSQQAILRYLKTRIKSREEFIMWYNSVLMPYASHVPNIPSAEELLSGIPLNENNNQEIITEWLWAAIKALAAIAVKMYTFVQNVNSWCCTHGWESCCWGGSEDI